MGKGKTIVEVVSSKELQDLAVNFSQSDGTIDSKEALRELYMMEDLTMPLSDLEKEFEARLLENESDVLIFADKP